jgi:cobalt-zinc-cadmium efflux system protein
MHSHSATETVSRKLALAAVFTGLFVVIELVAGTWSQSLALIGDAFHNFTDTLALLIALAAVRIARRPATAEKSYGYHRAGILAAFVNAGTLVGMTVFLFIEAADRLRNPHVVDTRAMSVVSIVAIVLNVAVSFGLRREQKDDVNIRSAVIHMVGDAVSSVGILIAALLIRTTGSMLWDPAISVAIGVMILWSSWGILRESMNLLLEGTPRGIDPEAVIASLQEIEGVEGIHHLHIWAVGPSSPALSCHVLVGDIPLRSTAALLTKINETLEEKHDIVHTTVQFEPGQCADEDASCIPSH